LSCLDDFLAVDALAADVVVVAISFLFQLSFLPNFGVHHIVVVGFA
jgi:hypothetical protein